MIYLDVLSVADDVAGHIKRSQELFPGGDALMSRKKVLYRTPAKKQGRLYLYRPLGPALEGSGSPDERGLVHLNGMVRRAPGRTWRTQQF